LTIEERYKITSEEYADLMVEYNENMRAFDIFPNATIQLMTVRNAVVYVPVSQITGQSISQYGYSILPSCYGLNSERSLEASGVLRLRRIPALSLRGQGVLVGTIDTGIDYMNPVFLQADGTSKIVALWDQTIESDRFPEPELYGTEYLAEDINRALKSENPLEIVPSVDDNGHGTMMAGIAAGSEVQESDFSGVAPDAELIVVKLKQAKQPLREFYVLPDNVPANEFLNQMTLCGQ